MAKRIWSFDGVMTIWQKVPLINRKIRVLRLGDGLGSDTNNIGKLAAAAPDLLAATHLAQELLDQILPQIGKLSLDIGKLNDFFLLARPLLVELKGELEP